MSKQKKFFNGKGYYIALILGAVAIGVTGYLYYANANEEVNLSNQDPAAQVMQTENSTNPSESTAPTEIQKPRKPQKRTKPVEGQTLVGYALDMLCYNETTRDWRTHDGVDFAAQAGANVTAAAEGTVQSVYEDDRMGMTVVLEHEGGYTTTYSSLAQEVSVKAGDKVTAGQIIGTVANTALMENAIGDHLHFAVSCNGESLDPMEFLAD